MVGSPDNPLFQFSNQNIFVLRLVYCPMFGKDVGIAVAFVPQQGHFAERVGDMQVDQVGCEEVFFYIVKAILVHPQQLQFA